MVLPVDGPDDFSRYIIAWKLCTTMKAEDVTATLEMARDAAGLEEASVLHRPRLLSDNGSSYISDDLAKWLERHDMAHVRGAPYHPMTQGKIVTYTKEQKHTVLGVSSQLLREKGAVCGEVARAMAEGALANSTADVAIGITGVAGPEPDEDGNPVGRTCFALARRGAEPQTIERHYGDIGRDAVRESVVRDVLTALIDYPDTTLVEERMR